MAQALRLAAEFVAGILLGGAIGWGFDRLFNTSPWGLIAFVLLGFAAGALNAARSAGVVPEREGILGRKPDGRD
jgi:ATP synthase protein I